MPTCGASLPHARTVAVRTPSGGPGLEQLGASATLRRPCARARQRASRQRSPAAQQWPWRPSVAHCTVCTLGCHALGEHCEVERCHADKPLLVVGRGQLQLLEPHA